MKHIAQLRRIARYARLGFLTGFKHCLDKSKCDAAVQRLRQREMQQAAHIDQH